jgi:hypothetical protein
MKKHKCPCCEYLTLEECSSGSYEVCPVCFWEDDYIQSKNPNLEGGANKLSLNQARNSFLKIKASHPDFVKKVREPLPDEYP